MKPAKYYTYRNLNRGQSFSVKQRGLVVIRLPDCAIIRNGEFVVSLAGRSRCVVENKRNVHAFIASVTPPVAATARDLPQPDSLIRVSYNPFRQDAFITEEGIPIQSAEIIILINGRCYVRDGI